MVKYECGLVYRPRFGPISICDNCITEDCTNPIYDVTVHTHLLHDAIPGKERLYSDSDKPLEKRTLKDYWAVMKCEGVTKQKVVQTQISS